MNELNYASLKASKRLVDNGIVLKTDAIWCQYLCGYRLIMRTELHPLTEVIPAPSMAEVWRELPDGITIKKWDGKLLIIDDDGTNFNINPADALIEFWVWLKEQNREGGKP